MLQLFFDDRNFLPMIKQHKSQHATVQPRAAVQSMSNGSRREQLNTGTASKNEGNPSNQEANEYDFTFGSSKAAEPRFGSSLIGR